MERFKNEYLSEPEIVSIAKRMSLLYENDNVNEAVSLAVQIFKQIKANPHQLRDVQNFEDIGSAFLIMLNHKVSNDTDTLQLIASIGYLCLSKAIEKNNQNIDLYKDRYFLLEIGQNYFKETVISALGLVAGINIRIYDGGARAAIYRMQIADVELNPILYIRVDPIRQDRIEYINAIERKTFSPDMTIDDVVKSGLKNHSKLINYLENKIIKDLDLDF